LSDKIGRVVAPVRRVNSTAQSIICGSAHPTAQSPRAIRATPECVIEAGCEISVSVPPKLDRQLHDLKMVEQREGLLAVFDIESEGLARTGTFAGRTPSCGVALLEEAEIVRSRYLGVAREIFSDETGVVVRTGHADLELRARGYRKLSARPRHCGQAEGAIEDFKKPVAGCGPPVAGETGLIS
jgi:hypothetical protein